MTLHRLSLSCGLPSVLIRGTGLSGMRLSVANRGLNCLARTGRLFSPRGTSGGKKCPLPHAIVFNVGISFWVWGCGL